MRSISRAGTASSTDILLGQATGGLSKRRASAVLQTSLLRSVTSHLLEPGQRSSSAHCAPGDTAAEAAWRKDCQLLEAAGLRVRRAGITERASRPISAGRPVQRVLSLDWDRAAAAHLHRSRSPGKRPRSAPPLAAAPQEPARRVSLQKQAPGAMLLPRESVA
ncbi:hypothetical protein WJX81_002835 [Elliptochloris bilobata]|uniref:Uncharacterized protein n=1 Tax=Elliptochloris bilobata TaxID=381761 RepID=A0AAW1R0X1_9CHLO